jgi:hypothetical protein
VRSRRGARTRAALVVLDGVYGFLPAHPHAPATKRPLVAPMKRARTYGVGVGLATQNRMDRDYRALSNAGVWCVGRLQTDADRESVVVGPSHAGGEGPHAQELSHALMRLAPRWFLVRDAHADGLLLLRPRYAMSVLRGPRRARGWQVSGWAERRLRTQPGPRYRGALARTTPRLSSCPEAPPCAGPPAELSRRGGG